MLLAQSVHSGHAWPIMCRQKWKLTTLTHRLNQKVDWLNVSFQLEETWLIIRFFKEKMMVDFLVELSPQFCGLFLTKAAVATFIISFLWLATLKNWVTIFFNFRQVLNKIMLQRMMTIRCTKCLHSNFVYQSSRGGVEIAKLASYFIIRRMMMHKESKIRWLWKKLFFSNHFHALWITR